MKNICVIGSLIFTLIISIKFAGEGPVAKVRLRSIETHMPLSRYYATDFAWVDVVEVYNPKGFDRGAEKISDDGKRANIILGDDKLSKLKSGQTYYFYTFDGKELRESQRLYIGRKFFAWVVLSFLTIFFEWAIWEVIKERR